MIDIAGGEVEDHGLSAGGIVTLLHKATERDYRLMTSFF
jgi:hypothetical protein